MRKKLKLGILGAGMCLSFGLGAEWAIEDRYLLAGLAGLISWNCYLFFHYFETGTLIEEDFYDEKVRVSQRMERRILLLFCVMAAGIPLALYGVYIRSSLMIAAGLMVFFTGYTAAHKKMTGLLV